MLKRLSNWLRKAAPSLEAAAAVGVAAGLAACAASLPPPDQPGAAQAYRAALAKEPKGDAARPIREGLEAAEYASAKRAHTILAYRRFLSEFPGGPFTSEARARLESLRWNEAETAGTDAALAGFLADEPTGAHAAEAWEKLAALRLKAALAANTEESLRGWLSANPTAAGRDQAAAALDEAQFAAAQGRSGSASVAGLRAYLADQPDGRHRAEVQKRLLAAEIAEAALLEDEQQLAVLSRSAGSAAARAALESVRAARSAALDPPGANAKTVEAAHALFLPRPTPEDLPADVADRARLLRSWALAADGARLGKLLSELGSTRAWLALVALDAAQSLIASLPAPERQARAARLLESLRPKAQSSALLVALSLLEEAAGAGVPDKADAGAAVGAGDVGPAAGRAGLASAAGADRRPQALEQARSALARDRTSLLAASREALIESEIGEAPVALFAVHTLLTAAQAWAEVHADAARPSPDRLPDATALLELCAAGRAVSDGQRALAAPKLSAEPGVAEAKARAARVAASIASRLEEGEQTRQAARREHLSCAALQSEATAEAKAAVARRRTAAHELAAAGPAALPAIERARARDPDPEVQRLLNTDKHPVAGERAATGGLR